MDPPKGFLDATLSTHLTEGTADYCCPSLSSSGSPFPFVAMKHHVHAGWWLESSVSVSVLVIANHKWQMTLQALHPGQFWPHSKMLEHSWLSLSQRAVKQNDHKPQAVSPREVLQNPGSARELGKYCLCVSLFRYHCLERMTEGPGLALLLG